MLIVYAVLLVVSHVLAVESKKTSFTVNGNEVNDPVLKKQIKEQLEKMYAPKPLETLTEREWTSFSKIKPDVRTSHVLDLERLFHPDVSLSSKNLPSLPNGFPEWSNLPHHVFAHAPSTTVQTVGGTGPVGVLHHTTFIPVNFAPKVQAIAPVSQVTKNLEKSKFSKMEESIPQGASVITMGSGVDDAMAKLHDMFKGEVKYTIPTQGVEGASSSRENETTPTFIFLPYHYRPDSDITGNNVLPTLGFHEVHNLLRDIHGGCAKRSGCQACTNDTKCFFCAKNKNCYSYHSLSHGKCPFAEIYYMRTCKIHLFVLLFILAVVALILIITILCVIIVLMHRKSNKYKLFDANNGNGKETHDAYAPMPYK